MRRMMADGDDGTFRSYLDLGSIQDEFLTFCIFSKIIDCRTWYVGHIPFSPNIRDVAVFVLFWLLSHVADRRFDLKGVSFTGG